VCACVGHQGNVDKAPIHRVNDVSIGAGLKQAKQYLPFFTRAGVRVPAVVEYVLSAHRFKLYIPKEGVQASGPPLNPISTEQVVVLLTFYCRFQYLR
jgi:hypothetical protein